MYGLGTLPSVPTSDISSHFEGLIEVAEEGLLPVVVVEPYVDIEITRLRDVVDRGVPPFLCGAFEVDRSNLIFGDVVEERFGDGLGHARDLAAQSIGVGIAVIPVG